jgi:hypothetical protein
MFEQELEMEKKEGPAFGPVLIILLLVGLFVGGIGFVIFQGKQAPKPAEASAIVEAKLNSAGPVQVTFDTGNLSYDTGENPADPQYKLLANAGILKIAKAKPDAAQVELTPAGKQFLASFPDVKGAPAENHRIAYTLPLAYRKLVALGQITRLNQDTFRVQYTWQWQTTKAGEMFDVAGNLVHTLSSYERGLLINQHGAKYYHAAPAQTFIVLMKGDHGWEPASTY